MASSTRWAMHVAIGVGAISAAVTTGCGKDLESGRYCDTQRASECVWVDIENQVVTFYERGRPIDVTGNFANGLIATNPKQGPFAGKTVVLSFDASTPKHVAIEVDGDSKADGAKRRLLYALK